MYFPENGRTKHPVVIAFPGLVECSEHTRADNILKGLTAHGIAGIVWTYAHPACEYEGRKGEVQKLREMSFQLNTEIALPNIKAGLEYIHQHAREGHYDKYKVGVLTSSIGAGLFGKLFERYAIKHHEVIAHTAISPLPGWNQFVDARTREAILKSEKDFNISSEHDKKNGLVRTIQQRSLKDLAKMDGLASLGRLNEKLRCVRIYGGHTDIVLPAQLTIMGKNDKTSDPEGMRKYHELMGGKPENLIEFESGHDVPEEESNQRVIDFFVEQLK